MISVKTLVVRQRLTIDDQGVTNDEWINYE